MDVLLGLSSEAEDEIAGNLDDLPQPGLGPGETLVRYTEELMEESLNLCPSCREARSRRAGS